MSTKLISAENFLVNKMKTFPSGNTPTPKDVEAWLLEFTSMYLDEPLKLLERAKCLVGNPGTNISSSTDFACIDWQNDYDKWVLELFPGK